MGYFDDIVEKKKDLTQEAADMDRFAGNAFWFSIGSLGMFLTTATICLLFWFVFSNNPQMFSGWLSLGDVLNPNQVSCAIFSIIFSSVPFLACVAFSVLGVVYGLKAQKSASMIRQKNPLKNVAIAYSLLWMILTILFFSINIYKNLSVIIS